MRDIDDSGVHVSSSTVRRRLLENGRKARRPKKKQLLTAAMKQKRFNWAKNTKTGLKMIGAVSSFQSRVLFSDESNSFVEGFIPNFIRCSPNEKLREEHFVQTVKHPDKRMF